MKQAREPFFEVHGFLSHFGIRCLRPGPRHRRHPTGGWNTPPPPSGDESWVRRRSCSSRGLGDCTPTLGSTRPAARRADPLITPPRKPTPGARSGSSLVHRPRRSTDRPLLDAPAHHVPPSFRLRSGGRHNRSAGFAVAECGRPTWQPAPASPSDAVTSSFSAPLSLSGSSSAGGW